MVKHYSEQLDRTFFAISDPTRRAIIDNLAARGTCTVMELAEPFAMSLPAISKHLKLLENANLITRERKGRIHYLKLCGDPMAEANEWLATYSRFWQGRLDALAAYLESADLAQEGENNDFDQSRSAGDSASTPDDKSSD
ncbi:MAG: helix-turn-helix transcriptional regulator [Cyanobacteria bacterium SZAS LIN-2]|nr:helix-turn-helix transcriptional regulator [Cyanobacteria bacterium SZAS LIN-3]MBS1998956.1 helix-turn-helix transcriptional regulator [Cyanobacteria bacterium SZAS LIN-2]MBS2010139.1 helix-turn-helix transcriptional regulator [Cyanobacteria bacterium SZAS TMP-1]